jgi:hypothetical protein
MALNPIEETQYITNSEDELYLILDKANVSNFFEINDIYIINLLNDYKTKHFFKKKKFFNNEFLSIRNVTYSAAIASKARIKLYRSLLDSINDNGRILYYDTDSKFVAYPKSNLNLYCNNEK